jgi:alpha/beta superfamily hydrolase
LESLSDTRWGTHPTVPSAAVYAESTTLHTSDGLALEGELAVPDDAWAAAVVTHPHPQFGGTMRSIVTGALFAGLASAGVAAVRFNFRGVEGSEGAFDDGRGEQLDVVAAVDALAAATPETCPLILAGWSFGADVALSVRDARAAGWFAVAAPLRNLGDLTATATDPRPKLLVVPEHDQFRPPDSAREVVREWQETRLEVVGGADHYLVGRTDRVVELCVSFLRERSAEPGASRAL